MIRTPLISSLAQTQPRTRCSRRTHGGGQPPGSLPKDTIPPKHRSIRPRSARISGPNRVTSNSIDPSRYGL